MRNDSMPHGIKNKSTQPSLPADDRLRPGYDTTWGTQGTANLAHLAVDSVLQAATAPAIGQEVATPTPVTAVQE